MALYLCKYVENNPINYIDPSGYVHKCENKINKAKIDEKIIKKEAEIKKTTEQKKNVGKNNSSNKNNNAKLDGKEADLKWLGDNYKAVEVKGTVKVSGEVRDISRRVYQTQIDWNYVPKDVRANGLTNEKLALKGKSPYVIDKSGIETKVELHHLTQVE